MVFDGRTAKMGERLQTFRNRVDDNVDKWRLYAVNPYIIAYDLAYSRYKEALDAQKESDKALAELFVTAASIIPGSILMATAASGSLRVVAGRLALQALCKANLKKTFAVYNAIGGNPTAMFALGKLLDGAKDQVTKQAQSIVGKFFERSSDLLQTSPLSRDKQLDSWILAHKLCSLEVAGLIDGHSGLSEGEKNARFAVLRQAAIANSPLQRTSPEPLAQKIELGFYMMAVLDSDTLIDWPMAAHGDGFTTHGAKSRSIEVMPSSPKYPRPAQARPGFMVTPAHQSVGIARPGGNVQARIDELHGKLFDAPFYKPGGFLGFGRPDTASEKMGELLKAERVLTKLADAMRPTRLLEVKS